MKKQLKNLLKKHRGNPQPHDIIVCFSGGADSSYLLYMLKEKFKMNPLAVAVKHPFLSPVALKNMAEVPKRLGLDCAEFTVQPELFHNFIKVILESWVTGNFTSMAGCYACGLFHHMLPVNLAKKSGIALVAHGEDPAQVGRAEYAIQLTGDAPPKNPFVYVFQQLYGKYIDPMYSPFLEGSPVTEIYPYAAFGYDKRAQVRELKDQGILEHSDSLSTNCDAFHFFALAAFQYNNEFPYQEFINTALFMGQESVVDQILGTDKNLGRSETNDILEDYRQTLEAIAAGEEFTTRLPDALVERMRSVEKYMELYDWRPA